MHKLVHILFYCTMYAILNVSGAAIIKWKLKDRVLANLTDWISFLFQIPVVVAFIIIFASALTMFKALSSGNFSTIIPIATGINFTLTVMIGYLFFKDVINLQIIAGFVLIILGIIVISLNQS